MFSNKIFFKHYIFGILLLATSMSSCTKGESEKKRELEGIAKEKTRVAGEFDYFGDVVKCAVNEQIWQKQIKLAQENYATDTSLKLRILNFSLVKKIDTQNDITSILSLLVEHAFSVQYDWKQDNPKLISIDPLKSKDGFRSFVDTFFLHKISLSDSVGLVKIQWSYDAKKLTTFCLISNKEGVIYDNLLCSTIAKRNHSKLDGLLATAAAPISKTSTETINNGNINYTFDLWDEAYNGFGALNWSYRIYCEIAGHVSNNQAYLDNITSQWAKHDQNFGYQCSAAIQNKSIQRGLHGSVNFAWAWAHGWGTSINLIYSGAGFIVPTGSTGSQGEEFPKF